MRRRWERGRRRPERLGPVPAEQAGIIRAGKWAESHAVLANRPGATDDKPDGWQLTVSTLLWERGRRREATTKREIWELQVVRGESEGERGGGQSGNVFVNDCGEQMFTPGTWLTCWRWSYTNISRRQSRSAGRKPHWTSWASQPGYRPLSGRPRLIFLSVWRFAPSQV